ncbi:glycoside hydrolase family 55 protein [Schizophyllum amplum]|uniref:Glycoside hydrolase family 55 protein n=1 Tax=Schizophyllum amplum TaxID=97359 RepID=A0A550CCY1_9AGAR|nr:glycoside hydrolase family 55 protein [Auriculariopsis ampla]
MAMPLDKRQSEPFWLESITHQGHPAFSDDASYSVFRNVKDYGAVGDGVTDDTAAINRAISEGNRCGAFTCVSSTVTPAIVYFPTGSYLVSSPIQPYYFTQLIGDAKNLPTLLAAPGFAGMAIIDADPSQNGQSWYVNQNNFFRSVRNFVIDTRQVPATNGATGVHWQVAQATALQNIRFEMSTDANTVHQGIWAENGSGGFMSDLTFNGGKFGMWVGNQQFTVKNVTINNAQTAIYTIWNWGWTYQGVTINNCGVGFDLMTGGLTQDTQTTGGLAIIDATVTNTPIFVQTSASSPGHLAGSLVLNNAVLNNVPTAVRVADGTVVLAGGSMTIDSWAQGNVYSGANTAHTFTQGTVAAPSKGAGLTDGSGKIFSKPRPQYTDYSASQIVSAKSSGAKGDGVTDDTAALQALFNANAGGNVVFIDHGTYVVTSTLTVPVGSRIVGEVFSVIAGKGANFQDSANPQVVVKVGNAGDVGTVEIQDIAFSTIGPAGGAIVVEWNVAEDSQGSAGMWDCHIRLGGAKGTNLQVAQCPQGSNSANCASAYLALHLTPQSTAYLESTWVWNADHDLDDPAEGKISVFSGRGILSESAGPVWMIGTASEHHVLYQYNLNGAKNHYMGLIQTETPYYQPSPAVPAPFTFNTAIGDPTFPSGLQSSWALNIAGSENIFVFGAGLYSFFDNYAQTCLDTFSCQSQIVNVASSNTNVAIFQLSTVATTNMLSVDGSPVILQADNRNGFASTATVWTL